MIPVHGGKFQDDALGTNLTTLADTIISNDIRRLMNTPECAIGNAEHMDAGDSRTFGIRISQISDVSSGLPAFTIVNKQQTSGGELQDGKPVQD